MSDLTLFDTLKVAQVRRSDPRTARVAAQSHTDRKAEQWKVLLRELHLGPLTADRAGVIISRHRSTASSRLGVMVDRGLVEHAGEVEERPADGGRARWVLRYAITDAGRREYARLFGGAS